MMQTYHDPETKKHIMNANQRGQWEQSNSGSDQVWKHPFLFKYAFIYMTVSYVSQYMHFLIYLFIWS